MKGGIHKEWHPYHNNKSTAPLTKILKESWVQLRTATALVVTMACVIREIPLTSVRGEVEVAGGAVGGGVAILPPSIAAEVEAAGGAVVAIPPPSVAVGVSGATLVGYKVAPLALLLFSLWDTPTITPTITATRTSAPTIMMARPLVVRCQSVAFDLLTSFE